MHNFYITPTLIDSFLYLKDGGYPENKVKELFDKINKVKTVQDDSAKRGVAFESCVNLTLTGNPTNQFNDLEFDGDLVNKVVSKLVAYTGIQVWIEKIVSFSHGSFKVGGFADFTLDKKIIDLKTTLHYKLGKYQDYSQHKAFGLMLPENERFDYLITDFENVYLEPYMNKKSLHEEFISNVELFWDYCQENKHLIIDTKIWGNG
jgi:hypothetical protein